jgi:hypothetical protein
MNFIEGTFWRLTLRADPNLVRELDDIISYEEALEVSKMFLIKNHDIKKIEITSYKVKIEISKRPKKVLTRMASGEIKGI